MIDLWPTVNEIDDRWICWKCGDMDHLNDDGLCRDCKPERVMELSVLCARVQSGIPPKIERKWRIR